MKPLEVIGHLDIPPAALRHRFYVEALAAAKVMHLNAEEGESREKVIGTANTQSVELYGWAPHVDQHVDNTGYVYFVALNEGRSTVNVWQGDDAISVWLPAGTVVRLDDRFTHWTEDDQIRVCAFTGSYPKPRDYDALVLLQAALICMESGSYYTAPRVKNGFRAYLGDECLVANDGFTEISPMLLKDAIKQRKWYERCSACRKPAVRIDEHWPYHSDMNRCADHLKGENNVRQS